MVDGGFATTLIRVYLIQRIALAVSSEELEKLLTKIEELRGNYIRDGSRMRTAMRQEKVLLMQDEQA